MNEKAPKLLIFKQLRDHGVLYTRRQVDRLEKENKFPKRVPLSEWRVGWVTQEIDDWVAQKIAARSTKVGALGGGDKRVKRGAAQS